MSFSSAGTPLVANRTIRPNTTEHDQAPRQLILQIQSLLTLLDSLSPDPLSASQASEPKNFEVYDDDTYRYVSLRLPKDSNHEIDLNINKDHIFVRIAL